MNWLNGSVSLFIALVFLKRKYSKGGPHSLLRVREKREALTVRFFKEKEPLNKQLYTEEGGENNKNKTVLPSKRKELKQRGLAGRGKLVFFESLNL